MAKISLARLETARLSERMPLTVGGVETHVYFDRPLHPLALHVHRFKAGSAISLEPSDRDRILFVWLGTVEVLDEKLGAGSSAIVERGKGVHLAALSNEATVLEFFGRGEGADADDRLSAIHLLPRSAVPRFGDGLDGMAVGGALHADSSCPSCSIWLHENFIPPGSVGDPREKPIIHSHSVDEIIFVTAGEMRFGRQRHGPGTALAIAANAFYSFRPGKQGLAFVNFRAERPGQIQIKGDESVDEAAYWRDHVGSPCPVTICD